MSDGKKPEYDLGSDPGSDFIGSDDMLKSSQLDFSFLEEEEEEEEKPKELEMEKGESSVSLENLTENSNILGIPTVEDLIKERFPELFEDPSDSEVATPPRRIPLKPDSLLSKPLSRNTDMPVRRYIQLQRFISDSSPSARSPLRLPSKVSPSTRRISSGFNSKRSSLASIDWNITPLKRNANSIDSISLEKFEPVDESNLLQIINNCDHRWDSQAFACEKEESELESKIDRYFGRMSREISKSRREFKKEDKAIKAELANFREGNARKMRRLEQLQNQQRKELITNKENEEKVNSLEAELKSITERNQTQSEELEKETEFYNKTKSDLLKKQQFLSAQELLNPSEIELIEKLAGVRLVIQAEQTLTFIFTLISRADPEKEFGFTVGLSGKRYNLLSSSPALPNQYVLINELNQKRSFYKFICQMRTAFSQLEEEQAKK